MTTPIECRGCGCAFKTRGAGIDLCTLCRKSKGLLGTNKRKYTRRLWLGDRLERSMVDEDRAAFLGKLNLRAETWSRSEDTDCYAPWHLDGVRHTPKPQE